MATKSDLSPTSNLLAELTQYQTLFVKTDKTTTGNPSWTSPTSGAVYTVNTNSGEVGLLALIKAALLEYMITAADFNAVVPIMGSSTFNSTTGVTITHNIGNTNYKVYITPTGDPGATLGEVYVTKNNNTIVVYCSGTNTTTTFDYVIYK
jgi:hypothetical protein